MEQLKGLAGEVENLKMVITYQKGLFKQISIV